MRGEAGQQPARPGKRQDQREHRQACAGDPVQGIALSGGHRVMAVAAEAQKGGGVVHSDRENQHGE